MSQVASRSTWTGAVSFGMVNIPVKMYGATSAADIKFSQYHNPGMCAGPQKPSERLNELLRQLQPFTDRVLAEAPDDIDPVTGMPSLKTEWRDMNNAFIGLEDTMSFGEDADEQKRKAQLAELQNAVASSLGPVQGDELVAVAPAARKIGRKEVCAHCNEAVDRLEIQRGYVVTKEQVLLMEETDFTSLPVPTLKAIQVVQFIEDGVIDPRHTEKSYLLVPDEAGGKAFALLLRGMQGERRVAVAKISIRSREHLAVIRPQGDAMLLQTLYYDDELRDAPHIVLPEVSVQELGLAGQLISALEGEWDATQYEDNYRKVLLARIEAKVAGTPVEEAEMPEPVPVIDLTAGLLASIAAAKEQAA